MCISNDGNFALYTSYGSFTAPETGATTNWKASATSPLAQGSYEDATLYMDNAGCLWIGRPSTSYPVPRYSNAAIKIYSPGTCQQ